MNIILTGSLGHISQPLAALLVKAGHAVTVISRSDDKRSAIEALGATAAIDSIDDARFLADTFRGADAVYLMEPPFNFFDPHADMEAHWLRIADSYAQAVRESGVRQIVHLSSIGAHRDSGVGMLSIHHAVENVLAALPSSVIIKTMRPVGFYYNMYAFLPTIRKINAVVQNYGGDEREPWVSPLDIAAAIADALEKPFEERTVRYIASDEASPNEVAAILGEATGRKDLTWTTIRDEAFEHNLVQAGFSPTAAKGLTEMNAARRNGILYEDYYRHRPAPGSVKLKDFAREFATVFQSAPSDN